MSDNDQNENYGKQIGDTVKSALESGDLSRLRHIGPVIQNAVQKGMGSGGGKNPQQPPPPPGPSPHGQAPAPGAGQPNYARPAWQGGAAHTGAPQMASWQGTSRAVVPNKPARYYGLAAIILGGVGLGVFAACTLILAIVSLFFGGVAFGALGMLAPLAFCGVLLGVGISRKRFASRIQKIYAPLLGKNVCTLEEISAAAGLPEEQVKKDVKRGIARKLLPDVRMDVQETCLMRGDDAWQLYQASEEARRARELDEAERKRRLGDPATAELEAFREEGAATLRKIREANDAIPGEEISAKLSQLETTTGKIFGYVEKHPAKLPDTRRFMNYYLPTTLKLVEKYRHFDEMEVQLANVQRTKGEIESSLDTINDAFRNLLESLYQEDTMDVSTDIEVLQAVLEQEGLVGKKFEIDGGEPR